ncbi:hypothetical protein PtrM4_116250 [Pyrenophora tritici-repentis]|uniref:Uncharacterized protein n=1 Tax=Pyrenophora tritici-repentis TaxID=45151 RepID=A0A834RSC1_9PLEO|nr:hypothetical protein PtrM4_116250 [Pyrenophora tritici-repentis]
MADKLLAARGAGQVRQKWPANFVKRTDSLRTCFNRAYDRQRALCENLALIRSWFELIEKTKAELSICDKDIYNFDEASFIMGKITTQLVITGVERRGRPKTLQLGNRDPTVPYLRWLVPPISLELCKENNIYTLSFRGAGLVPLQLEAVLSKLDVQLRTPTPLAAALPEAPWVAQTPSNARKLEA